MNKRLVKIIAICAAAVVLLVSLSLNVFLLYKAEADSGQYVASKTPDTSENESKPSSLPDDKPSCHCCKKRPNVTVDISADEEPAGNTGVLVYEDENIRVTYLQSANKTYGPAHKFRIENTSKKTLTVLFTDVYIGGRQVFTSGLTCEHLLPETEAVEELILLKTDWEHFTDSPDKISFKIKLVNDKSHLDLYESARISMEF